MSNSSKPVVPDAIAKAIDALRWSDRPYIECRTALEQAITAELARVEQDGEEYQRACLILAGEKETLRAENARLTEQVGPVCGHCGPKYQRKVCLQWVCERCGERWSE